MPGIYILIPAYNEERTIAKIILNSKRYGNVIVCDDGSMDDTAGIAEGMGALVVRHERNRGYGAALRSLFKKALEYDPEMVITIDADLQHDPSYIPILIEALRSREADIVIGARSGDDETPGYRRVAVKLISKTMPLDIYDVQSGFRAYRGEVLRDLIPHEDGMEASLEILERAHEIGLRIVEVPVRFRYRGLETSSQNLFTHGYDLISRILHSKLIRHPIGYLAIPGIILFITGFISGLWVVSRYIEVRQLAIGTAFITAILTISGLMMVLIAILLYAMKEYSKYVR